MTQKRNILLYPLSLIYGLITAFRNFLYDSGILHTKEFTVPVICVGNITVGGTGKTPHTEYLAELLKLNFKVATLSRGYKRKTSGFRIASSSSTVNDIGDEPLQIYRNHPEIIVTVDTNRVSGVKRVLLEHPDTDVIILDDAFQHRRISPGFSILLSDFNRPIMSDHMLPYGNLRENKINMRRADIILITKSPEDLSAIQRRIIVKEIEKEDYQNLYFTSFKYKEPVPVFGESRKENQPLVPGFQNSGLVLITGIANPLLLKEYLRKSHSEIIHLDFPDHYNYSEKDLQEISAAYNNLKSKSRYLITTEKDSVRFREFTNIAEPIKSAFYYIPIGISFLNEDKDEFDNLIIDYVRKNHRNHRVSEGQGDN
jgi:tetraacyldisaccharide 4'-kinase